MQQIFYGKVLTHFARKRESLKKVENGHHGDGHDDYVCHDNQGGDHEHAFNND